MLSKKLVGATAASLLFAGVVSAQGNNLATIEWFESNDCVLDKSIPAKAHTTVVTIEQQLCQTVPQGDGATAAGYSVVCDATGGGTISFFGSNTCGPADLLNAPRQFTQGGCNANAPGFGALSFRITCNPSVPIQVPQLGQGQFAALWHELPNCQPLHETLVVGDELTCQVVPQFSGAAPPAGASSQAFPGFVPGADGANSNNIPGTALPATFTSLAGYEVQCSADGSGGVIRFSGSGTCGAPTVATAFRNGACLPNSLKFGAASVQFFCGAGRVNPGQTHARINWFEATECRESDDENQHRTVVIANQGFCQRVPDRDLSYRVTCGSNSDGSSNGRGTVQFCDATCTNCPFAHDLANNQCQSSDPGYGSASFSISCASSDLSVTPKRGDAGIRWIELASCEGETRDFTQLLVPQGLCMIAPGANGTSGNTGYKVECNNEGTSGVFSTCDRNCENCGTRTPFNNDQCLANPAATGSQSVKFTCAPPLIQTAGASALSTAGAVVAGLAGAAAVLLN